MRPRGHQAEALHAQPPGCKTGVYVYLPLTYSLVERVRWPRAAAPRPGSSQPVRAEPRPAGAGSQEGRGHSLEDEARLVWRQPGRGSLGESGRVRRHELCGESLWGGEAHAGGQGRAL